MQWLPLALDVERQRLPARSSHALGKLSPPLNRLAIYRANHVAFFQSRSRRRHSRSDIFQDRLDRRKTQSLLRLLDFFSFNGNLDRAPLAVIFDFHGQFGVWFGLGDDLLCLRPVRDFARR